MTTPTPLALAREGLELAEKATPPTWTVGASWPPLTAIYHDCIYIAHTETGEGKDWIGVNPLGAKRAAANAALIAHCGTHHATICRALIAAEEEKAAAVKAADEADATNRLLDTDNDALLAEKAAAREENDRLRAALVGARAQVEAWSRDACESCEDSYIRDLSEKARKKDLAAIDDALRDSSEVRR